MKINLETFPRRTSTARRPDGLRAIFAPAVLLLAAAHLAAIEPPPAIPATRATQPAPPTTPATPTAAPPAAATAPATPDAGTKSPASAAAPATQPLPTVQELLARSTAARGGHEKLQAAKTRRETGRISFGAGSEFPLIVEHKRPHSMRMEIELQGAKLIRIFDGAHGWQLQPQSKAPEALAADDLHNIANEADFDFAAPLVDTYARAGAELLGKEAVDGHDAYKVKITLPGGDIFLYDVDRTSYLPLRWEGARMINGKPVVFVSACSDYRDVDGVKYPFLMVASMKSSTQKQTITYTKIETNVAIDDSHFAAPAAAAAAAPASPPASSPPASSPPPHKP